MLAESSERVGAEGRGLWDRVSLVTWVMASYDVVRILSAGPGGNQANLKGALLNALKIPAPDISEQRRIVACLATQLAEADAIALSARLQLAEREPLSQWLLAQAFGQDGDAA